MAMGDQGILVPRKAAAQPSSLALYIYIILRATTKKSQLCTWVVGPWSMELGVGLPVAMTEPGPRRQPKERRRATPIIPQNWRIPARSIGYRKGAI